MEKGENRVCVVDPIPLMVAYLDGKPELTLDEKEILLFALYLESSNRGNGLADKALGEIQRQV